MPRETTGFPEIKEIGSFNRFNLDGHVAVDVQIHRSLGNVILVNKLGHIFRHAPVGDNNP